MSFFSFLFSGISSQPAKTVGNLFRNGDFIGSQKAYQEILITRPDDLKSLVYMGYTSLLFNHTEESEKWLNKAKAIKPKLTTPDYFLAEVYHRQLQFSKAAPLYRNSGREAMAKKMEYFAGMQPYQMDNGFQETRIRFLITDPLPVVEVTINNEYKGYFIIDTGGGELTLSEEFANQAKAVVFGVESGNAFGGGKKAPMGHGAIHSITLGELQVKNIPVVTLNLNQLELGGYRIDGVIGTVFLYQFLSTIDYKNGQLILRNKTRYHFSDIVNNIPACKIIPYVMADDHFMMARGSINNSDTLLLFVDTGLAGNAFTCPKSALKKLGLSYDIRQKNKATGGGGYFNMYPMEIDRLCLGGMCVNNLHGVFGAFPDQLENSFGFTISGLISHEFFRNCSLTLDFETMNYIIGD